MAKNFVDLSTAGIHVGYAIEATAGTKPTAFIDPVSYTHLTLPTIA